jgi:N-dimethylarginine dimethylaminohydrolase
MEDMNRLLVCPPDYYRIAYEINTWMHVEVAADQQLAQVQWNNLMAVLEKECGALLERMPPAPDVPDLVFTANAAAIHQQTAVLSRFRHPQRQPEEAHFERWLHEHGYHVERLPSGLYFEGAGDLLGFDGLKFGGYRQRTDIQAYQHVGQIMECEIIPVELVDSRFYHLDTCFCPLTGDALLWYPPAFDQYGQLAIEGRIPASRRLAVPEQEAVRFACNAVCLGQHVVLPDRCPKTMALLQAHGYLLHAVNLSEFLKAGGAAKCLTLALD